ncbi:MULTISPECIES: hypothetical protein [Heyndrickxia]|uniref:Spore coat protein n=1 Tax=Heyndrickxia coagulans 36D1 TaxID=345219 RepID=G2TQ78_HEYCO|nr:MULTISPECIES: hypothetical protein [Heyndrickxia]AEO99726.1 hypothetical protein Bcoa_0503 [Heyndrickxia coagulans 36D1]KYC92284.1 hypothetical protein B4096_0473 [Heyndrickxia coagulans]MBQ4909732.1 hypothetical protein [Heyndrickxia faecalis]
MNTGYQEVPYYETFNHEDVRLRPWGFGGFGFRPWGFRPWGFGFGPFLGGFAGGLATSALLAPALYGGYGFPYGGYGYFW